MFPSVHPTRTNAYQKLKAHYAAWGAHARLSQLFEQDSERFERFSLEHRGFLFDYSKHILNEETKRLLLDLALECQLPQAMQAFIGGEKINVTENRSVMHMALRHFGGVAIASEFTAPSQATLKKIKAFVQAVHQGTFLGYTSKPIRYIVNIGIGGSDLGPAMVCEALSAYRHPRIQSFFVSNVDGSHLHSVLQQVDIEETLFLVASKTFTTQETMANAHQARAYLLEHYQGEEKAVACHFVAMSTNLKEVERFGISPAAIFGFWDWVGGRFSLWSSIGLSIALTVGYEHFEQLLRGAEDVDIHFFSTPLENNIPVWMALVSFWYTQFFGVRSEAILPYAQHLDKFPAYLQQAIMESNGKSVDRNGEVVDYPTCPVVWGEPGTNGQHAFYQLLHQGTQIIPMDFIGFCRLPQPYTQQHELLIANLFAQSQAFMVGKTMDEVKAEMQASGATEEELKRIAAYRTFDGNRPSHTFLFERLDAFSLGQLIALYEHKIFTQGVLLNVYSFDQWGVELGKKVAHSVLSSIQSKRSDLQKDASTRGLLRYFLNHQ